MLSATMLLASTDFWQQFYFVLYALLTCGFALAVLFSNNVVRMAFYLVLSLGSSAGLFFLAGAEFVGAMQLMIYVGGTLVLLIFGVMLTAQAKFVSMKTRPGEWILAMIIGGSLLFLLTSAALSVTDWTSPNPERHLVSLADSKAVTRVGLGLSGVRVDLLDEQTEVFRRGKEQWTSTPGISTPASDPHAPATKSEGHGEPAQEKTAQENTAQAKTEPAHGHAADPHALDEQLTVVESRHAKSGYMLPFVIVSMHLLVVLVGAAYMARTKRRS